jgi:hypothetical protein
VSGLLSPPEDEKEYQVSIRIADKEWMSGVPRLIKKKFSRYNVGLT